MEIFISPADSVTAAAGAYSSIPAASAPHAIDDLWIRRLPHEFSWNVSRLNRFGFVVYCLTGLAGYKVLTRLAGPKRALRTIGGVALGHAVLAGAAGVFYGPLAHSSVLAYSLSLTRTTPVLLALAAILAVAAIEKLTESPRSSLPRITSVLVAAVAVLLLLFVTWNPPLLALLILGILLCGAMSASTRVSFTPIVTGAIILAGAAALASSARGDRLTVDVPAGGRRDVRVRAGGTAP